MDQNSIAAYHTIKANGLLSKRRMEVYEALVHLIKATPNEVIRYYKNKYPDSNHSSFHARFSELYSLGVAKVVGSKKDDISGNVCDIWSITGNLPTKLNKKLTMTEKYHLALDFMSDKNILMEFSTLIDITKKEKN